MGVKHGLELLILLSPPDEFSAIFSNSWGAGIRPKVLCIQGPPLTEIHISM